jgi:hypothetical protein
MKSNQINSNPSKTHSYVSKQWVETKKKFKSNPYQYLSIPLIAALVGYVTNYVGVSMLFYPIEWTGISGLGVDLGWQGIVPAKRKIMAEKMVKVTISKLLTIEEMFSRLEPVKMAEILALKLNPMVYRGIVPLNFLKYFFEKTSKNVVANIEKLIDIKRIVVSGMTKDPTVLGAFFQKVGGKEL